MAAGVAQLAVFKAQVTESIFTHDTFYLGATLFLFLAVGAFGLIDAGLVRRKNLLDSWVQKMIAALLAGLGMAVVGYAIWYAQYNEAFGIKDWFGEALKQWWIGGTNFMHFAGNLNPKESPEADVFQVFAVFFVAYAAAAGALIHSIGLERAKARVTYVLAVVAGTVVMPFLLYLTWGSTSPLTNAGLHDYIGNFSFYIFIGTWAMLLAWRLGPRLGVESEHPKTTGPFPHNMGTTAFGVVLLMFCIPWLVLGCGYYIAGEGYFGIALTHSGIGIALTNVFMAFCGGAVTGGIIAYWKRSSIMALLGPIAGYVSGVAGFDVYKPWQMLLVAMGGPIVVYGGYLFMGRIKIDERKVAPLTLFGGAYSAIMVGLVAWHTKDGGYFGLTGAYAPGHSQITPQMQLAGIGVTVGAAVLIGLPLILAMEKLWGLRVSEQDELVGLDVTYWDLPSWEEAPPVVMAGVVGEGSVGNGAGARRQGDEVAPPGPVMETG